MQISNVMHFTEKMGALLQLIPSSFPSTDFSKGDVSHICVTTLPFVFCKDKNYTINNVLPKKKAKNKTNKYHKRLFFAFSAMQPEFYCYVFLGGVKVSIIFLMIEKS